MRTLLAALDFSETTEPLLEAARTLALAQGATLYLLHVEAPEPDFVGYEPGPQHVQDSVALNAIRHFTTEHSLRDRLRADGVDAHSLIVQGPTVESILNEAKRLSADMILIGSHGHGKLYHLLLGSTGAGVLKRAKCPVLVVPSPEK